MTSDTTGSVLDRLPMLRNGFLTVWLCTTGAFGVAPPKAINEFARTSWSAIDGIPGPVRALAQTPDGYLWLGTSAGLYRFDGLRFVAWEPGFGERLPDSPVLALCTAKDGGLWIGFGSGAVSQLRNGHLMNHLPSEGTPAGGVSSIAEDSMGAIWAGGPYGFSRLESGKWSPIGAELGYAAPGAQILFIDSKGNLWVATDGFDFHFSKNPVIRNTILRLAPGAKRFVDTGEAVGQVTMFAEALDGTVWMTSSSELTVRPVNGQGGSHSGVHFDSSPVYSLLFDRHGSAWIGLLDGFWRATDYGQLQEGMLDRLERFNDLPQRRAITALKDREGNLWFGTAEGVERFRENRVTPYTQQQGVFGAAGGELASTSDGSVWLVAYALDVVQRLRQGRFLDTKLPPYSPSDSSRLLAVYADRSGHVWVGGSFQLAEGIDGKFSFRRIPVLEARASVHAITEDSAGNLWVTVFDGANGGGALRLQEGKWTDFRRSSRLPNYRCRVLYGDQNGRVWFGFTDGEVALFEDGKFRVFSQKDGLPGGTVLTITGDRSGHIWIGSANGLSRFDHGGFHTLTKQNQLPGSSISGIVEDDEGYFWLAGSLAILRVSPLELQKAWISPSYRMQGTSFDALDGLPGLPRGTPSAVARAADGRLWFATGGGVAVIDPKHLPRNLLAPPVVIETVKADDQVLDVSSGLRLRPKSKNLEFQYTALSLTAPERVRFRYRLEGYDDDWRGPLVARQATYTNLPPKSYRFRVIACNNDGVWNEQGATLEFSILPAFYQTYWFGLTSFAVFGMFLWTLYRLRLRQVDREFNMRLEERIGERTRIARELHDTLLQSFHGSLIQMQAVRNIFSRRPEQAGQPLDDAIAMAEGAISESRDAIQDLRPQPATHGDLAELLSVTVQDLARSYSASGSPPVFHVTEEGERQDLDPHLQDEAYRIIRELLRNAFRHAQARHIEVDIRHDNRLLRIRIRDDGKGIELETLKAGGRAGHWGLVGTRERAKRIGAQLNFSSGVGAGTEVELNIPASIAYTAKRRPCRFQRFFKRVNS